MWGGKGDGREVQKGQNICIPMAESCWSLTENSVKQLSFSKAIILQFKKGKKIRPAIEKSKGLNKHFTKEKICNKKNIYIGKL